MDVYRQAGEIIARVREREAPAKALCLQKQVQKKRQTYAVVCETLRYYDSLADVLERCEFFYHFPSLKSRKEVVLAMAYDLLLGFGKVNTNQDLAAKAVKDSQSYMWEALEAVKRENGGVVPTSEQFGGEGDGEFEEGGADEPAAGNEATGKRRRVNAAVPELFKYLRVNTLKADTADAASKFSSCAPTADVHVPDLLVFDPANAPQHLHKHSYVRCGKVLLQDKASCLPAVVLLGAVNVRSPRGSLVASSAGSSNQQDVSGAARFRPEVVVDACAAPGNKTMHLAALLAKGFNNQGHKNGAPRHTVCAVECDERRVQLLRDRVGLLLGNKGPTKEGPGGEDQAKKEHRVAAVTNTAVAVEVKAGDFLKYGNDDAEALLLDPSCSASGMTSRIDLLVAPMNQERVQKLANVQKTLLVHALTKFPNAKRVVYSTCSVHREENEEVVAAVLERVNGSNNGTTPVDEDSSSRQNEQQQQQANTWALAKIMPKEWTTRAQEPFEEYCIRCDPTADRTNGFFVACFERVGGV